MNAPERIWAEHPDVFDDMGLWHATGNGPGCPHIRATPEALAASPEVQALIAEAVKAERERAAGICMKVSVEREGQIKAGADMPAFDVDVMQQTRWRAGKLQAEQLADAIRASASGEE